jgi:hypothetical protein
MSEVQTEILIELARMLNAHSTTGEIIVNKEGLARIPKGKALRISLESIEEPNLCDG